mmetsp:Transcript_43928/g.108695  ORF Transcript_43928/g.108695 Transcript_43928/m.108695 type:complete len:245 (+) Transcript_43928:292-1026(+)|eukprot:CAMPEP_0179874040 /NCGR_PEP_ID=MMETSP0982-20121206/22627_1 /TAXON_ID=483367 /ORGANISM="non described non described, Strain CCMP 2436" /LENGTH=244 /DNA_ID=CAMNT_0021765711 /DNA_START=297 /DNA_END=1031 /DNA_ORIENTATION=+
MAELVGQAVKLCGRFPGQRARRREKARAHRGHVKARDVRGEQRLARPGLAGRRVNDHQVHVRSDRGRRCLCRRDPVSLEEGVIHHCGRIGWREGQANDRPGRVGGYSVAELRRLGRGWAPADLVRAAVRESRRERVAVEQMRARSGLGALGVGEVHHELDDRREARQEAGEDPVVVCTVARALVATVVAPPAGCEQAGLVQLDELGLEVGRAKRLLCRHVQRQRQLRRCAPELRQPRARREVAD